MGDIFSAFLQLRKIMKFVIFLCIIFIRLRSPGTKLKMKYREDFTRCDGTKCPYKEKCQRHEAIVEARKHELTYGRYVLSVDCIQNNYSELVVCNDPEVSR